ncbi:MAG: amidohydrolase [Actinobacteria bacterium]|nr:amidohydrolase [Actinomycetota bacterium]
MQIEDLVLVSVDDHVVEPPDVFVDRVPAKYADLAPKLITMPDGTEAWEYLGNLSMSVGLNAVVGRPPADYGLEPAAFSDMRPGCYDVHQRVRDMDANGVLGSLNFPSWPGFAGRQFQMTPDKEMALALLVAYNDWHVDDWCGAYPGRFIPCGLVPVWDPALMAAEVRRLADKGCHSVTFSENPARLDLPSLHSDHWDPFWAACEDTQTVVNMHIGSSSQLVVTAEDAPMDVLIALQPINLVQAAADLIFSPVFRKFPTFKIAMSEGGIGWIPYFLERIDYTYEHHKAWTGQDFGDQLPSQVFKERVVTCFIDDAAGVKNRHDIGIDMITWECDYPHSDCTWPTSPERLMKSLDGVPDDEIDKMTHLNAMRHYQYDPFSVIPREECTVGALRARAADVDTGFHEVRKTRREQGTTASMLRDLKADDNR